MDLDNAEDLKKQAPTLAAVGSVNPFAVPAGYFENLQSHLSARINLEALRSGGDLTVPEGYFDHLPQRIESRVFAEGLKESAPVDGFIVPQAYFENLTDHINSRVFAEALKERQLGEGFAVPDGYFNDLEARIIASLEVKRPVAKVISIRSWIQYAAAACITIAIGTGVYLNNTKSTVASAQEAIASIPDEEIISYLQLHADAGDTPVILDNLDEKANSLPEVSNELSDEELQQYLDTKL